jgi:hypothetical protein
MKRKGAKVETFRKISLSYYTNNKIEKDKAVPGMTRGRQNEYPEDCGCFWDFAAPGWMHYFPPSAPYWKRPHLRFLSFEHPDHG